jgi:cysteine desulfurase
MSNSLIYLDYAATTPLDPRVIDAMTQCLHQYYGNPASRSHQFGWDAENLVEEARINVANLIGADPKEIVWTSGATESNNLALKGVAHFYHTKGKHIITCKTEHKSVLDTCRQLEREGFEITYLEVMQNGLIDLNVLEAAIRPDTLLVSIMHVNNEIGVVQDIDAIAKMVKQKGILLHVDAAQSAGKLPIQVEQWGVDLLSFSAHKLYGPKGIGALYVRRKPRVRIEAQMHGGGHERGMRSGTLATHQIVGFGEACRIALAEMSTETARIQALRDILWHSLRTIEAVSLNGDEIQRVSGNLNVSFHYVEGESLIMALRSLAVSSGSACTSASLEPSYVLRALGLSDEIAHSSIRFGIGRFTTESDIQHTSALVQNAVKKLRELSPLWDMVQEGIDLSQVEWAAH